METRDRRFARPSRPTSLSLESVCSPDWGVQGRGKPRADIRRTQSFHSESQILLDFSELTPVPNTTDTEYQPSSLRDAFSRARNLEKEETFPVEKVSVSVATAGGKIAPDWRLRRPVVPVRYSTIDHSFSKGGKKEVTSVSTSLSKDCPPKKPTFEDFSLNRAVSRAPSENDYSYGSRTV